MAERRGVRCRRAVPEVTVDGRERRVRPCGPNRVFAGMGDQDIGVGAKPEQEVAGVDGGILSERPRDRVARARPLRRRSIGRRPLEQVDVVADARGNVSRGRPEGRLLADIGECDQVAGEIAAVDRGDILRLQRPEIRRVVPVVEVAAEPLHPAHCPQRRREPVRHVAEADPAEVARRGHRQQIEADIGRRRSPGELGLRRLLIVVGRQEILLGSGEALEIGPCASGDQTQVADVSLLERRCAVGDDAARDVDQRRCRDPGQREGQRDQAGEHCRREGDDRADDADRDARHHPAVEGDHAHFGRAGGLLGRHPVEHPAPRHAQPPERADDRVDHRPGLVHEGNDEECRLEERATEVVAECAEALPPRHAGAPPVETDQVRDQCRERQRGEDEQRPYQRPPGRQQPAGEQRRNRRWGVKRAPEVVEHLPAPEGWRSARGGAVVEDPGQQLPVASGPAVNAGKRDVVAAGKLLEKLDVARQS